MTRSHILLVDDHAIWRGGVKSMLEDTEFEVIGEAASGTEAIEKARARAAEADHFRTDERSGIAQPDVHGATGNKYITFCNPLPTRRRCDARVAQTV